MSDTPSTPEPIQPANMADDLESRIIVGGPATQSQPPVTESKAAEPAVSTLADAPEPQATVDVSNAPPTLDLSLGTAYRGTPFTDIDWNWPSIARAAIALCDYLIANPAQQTQPLLPSRISLDEEGQLQVGSASIDEAVFFTAPEIVESAAASNGNDKRKAKKATKEIATEAAAAETAAAETAAVYHIGAFAYYLLVNCPPIGNFVDIEQVAPATPGALKDTLLRALAVDAKKRTPSLAELRTQLCFVLDPPAWFEKAIPRLSLDDETEAKLISTLNRAQLTWYRLRDRIPWQRLDKTRKRYDTMLEHPRWGLALRLAGVLLLVLIYLVLVTDVI